MVSFWTQHHSCLVGIYWVSTEWIILLLLLHGKHCLSHLWVWDWPGKKSQWYWSNHRNCSHHLLSAYSLDRYCMIYVTPALPPLTVTSLPNSHYQRFCNQDLPELGLQFRLFWLHSLGSLLEVTLLPQRDGGRNQSQGNNNNFVLKTWWVQSIPHSLTEHANVL